MRLSSCIILAMALGLWSTVAMAQGCLVSTAGVQFGAYDPGLAGPLDATGEVDLTCDFDLPYTIRLGPGQNTGGGFSPRRMLKTDGAETLAYNLFRNASRTEVWGDGTSNTFTATGVGTGGTVRHVIYARVQPGQRVPKGRYEDIVDVLIDW